MISAVNLSRWYGDVIAVNDMNLELAPGVTGLLGPNGSGKTTLLKMCVGLLRPSAGQLTVLGEVPWDNPGLLARIGYVPEAPAPWRELTGTQCLLRSGRLYGLVHDGDAALEERVARALAKVGLTDAAERTVNTYSHGMQQRLKFALATLHEPELLILDEPLLGTDPIARRDLLRLIREAADGGATVLLSTHVLPDIEALTDRIALMHHGRLLAYGAVEEIRDLLDRHPRNIRIATTEAARLGAELWTWPEVLSLQNIDGGVLVRTKNPVEFHARLQEYLAAGNVPFGAIVPLDESVEAVFEYLVTG